MKGWAPVGPDAAVDVRGWSIRGCGTPDIAAVRDLADADRVAGQPPVDDAAVAAALGGHSQAAPARADLPGPARTDVLTGADGSVVGVVSFGVRPTDGVGVIAWLHAKEDPAAVRALLAHALALLPPEVVAFDAPSVFAPGLDGLAVGHRPATAAALTAAGFTAVPRWRYLHTPLPIAGLPLASHLTVHSSADPPGFALLVREGHSTVAEAVVGAPVAGTAMVWRLHVAPDQRRHGLGYALLGSALARLAGLGAREAAMLVDDTDPEGPARAAAARLCVRTGFTEIDRLRSFERRTP